MGGGFQSGPGSSRHNGSSVSTAASSSGLLTSLVSASLVLVHLPHPRQTLQTLSLPKELYPISRNRRTAPLALEQGLDENKMLGFLLCLLKDWEVKGLMGAVKPIPSKAYNKPQALPLV